MIRRILISLTAVAFAIMTPGCLVVTGSSYHESGVKVTLTTLDRLEVGSTTEAWVIATLGEPTARTEVEGQPNVAILRYEQRTTEHSGGTVLFLFAGGKDESHTSTAYIEVTDGIVTDFWTE